MRNYAILALSITTLVALVLAYSQFRKYKRANAQLKAEKTELTAQMTDAFNRIEQNLAEINMHESVVMSNLNKNPEEMINPEERINAEIAMIEALIAENTKVMSEMESELGVKDEQLVAYEQRIDRLSDRLKDYKRKASDLEELRDKLTKDLELSDEEKKRLASQVADQEMLISDKNSQLAKKEEDLQNKDLLLAAKELELNEAFFAVGSPAELKDAGVVEREGGFIGIGGAKTVQDDLNTDVFTRIDRRYYTKVPLYCKKARLISNHPDDSYEIVEDEEGVKWISIKDTDKFWLTTDYLVVETRTGFDLGLASK